MPFSSVVNFIHSDTKFFGSNTDPGIFYRDPTTGKLTFFALGTANAGKYMVVSAGGIPDLVAAPSFTLADDSVTFAKMQNINSSTILGRVTAGSGDPEMLTTAQVQTLLGLGNAAYRTVGTGVNNLVEVLAGGKIDPAIIPSIAIGTAQTVATNAAKLALTGLTPGEAIVRVTTDETRGSKASTYALIGTPLSSESSWLLLSDEQVDAGDIVSGVIAPARLGTGTPNTTNFLRGDGSWQVVNTGQTYTPVTANGTMAINTREAVNAATRVTRALPAVSAAGDQIRVTDINGNGWRITQAAGQQIFLPTGETTTLGTGGYLENGLSASNNAPNSKYCSVLLECVSANNTWLVVQASSVLTYI